MIEHLRRRVHSVERSVTLVDGDVVLDIGSNDGTSLSFFSESLTRVGVDPTADKFRAFYPAGVTPINAFFDSDLVLQATNGRKVKAITAFSMLYDLEHPVTFMIQISKLLDAGGVFVFEQSYLPLMLERVAFDTICGEHVEYYGLRQIDWMLDVAGLEVIDVETNDINCGSFSVTAAHKGERRPAPSVEELRSKERRLWRDPHSAFGRFSASSRLAATALREFVDDEISSGNSIAGLGASTKGNVLLQYVGLGPAQIPVIGDVNPDKFGCVTPGTWIPIVSEDEVLRANFDSYLVLPWHFRDFFLNSEKFRDHRLVFPLPSLSAGS